MATVVIMSNWQLWPFYNSRCLKRNLDLTHVVSALLDYHTLRDRRQNALLERGRPVVGVEACNRMYDSFVVLEFYMISLI